MTMLLAPYESWDLTAPRLPPRSRLYSLAPIGVGTALVESLSSYLTRLAQAHGVTPWTLYRHEIAPQLQRVPFGSLCLTKAAGYHPRTVNGTGVLASAFSRALETLTQQRELRSLTLLKWAPVLPRPGLLRQTRAWCGACLKSWRAAGAVIYEPLLWTLQAVIVCPRHQQPLSLRCPSCQLQNGALDARLWPGHCSRCLQWLAPEEKAAAPAKCEEWQLWVGNELGELLAANAQVSPRPQLASAQRSLAAALAALSVAEISQLTAGLKIGRPSFKRWRLGVAWPRLPFLLKLCYSLELSLSDLLCGQELPAPTRIVRSVPDNFLPAGQRRSAQPQLEPGAIERSLQAALAEDPPIAVMQVISRLGLQKSGRISRCFPELCAAVAQRYAAHRRAQFAQRKEAAISEVERVAREMYEAGLPLRARTIYPRLTLGGLYRPEGRAALRTLKEELGVDQF